MKRPFFLFFMGLVLGEAVAISLNRIGFFVMALVSFYSYFNLFWIVSENKKKTEPSFYICNYILWFIFCRRSFAS